MEQTRDGFNLWGFQQRASPMLLGWTLGSTASGILSMINQNGAFAGFGSQFARWGAINAILMVFGTGSIRRNLARQRQREISAKQSPIQGDKPVERNVSFRNGVDHGIMARGAFLYIWNTLPSLMVYKGWNA